MLRLLAYIHVSQKKKQIQMYLLNIPYSGLPSKRPKTLENGLLIVE
mgnify:CR=1 FL=1